MPEPRPDPLIVTATLDEASQSRLDADRERWFPPERNHLAAHVTLFHALPGAEVDRVTADLVEVADRPAYDVEVAGVRFLGRGVAYELTAPDLVGVRADLAARWRPWLTRQDQQRFRPHVTVQNKVAPETARALYDDLTAAFVPWSARATGLALWRYVGGPWEPVTRVRFSAAPPDPPPGAASPPTR